MGKYAIFLTFYFLNGGLSAQSQNKIFEYILSENYEAIQQSFTQQVDVCILSYEAMLGKNEAVARLKDFFTKNKPVQYTVRHKGSSRANLSSYIVSDMYTQNGVFRLFLFLTENNGSIRVSEFRIEKA